MHATRRFEPGNNWFVLQEEDQIAVLLRLGTQVFMGELKDSHLERLRKALKNGEAYFLWAITPSGQEIWSPKNPAHGAGNFFVNFEGTRRNAATHGANIKGVWKISAGILAYTEQLCAYRESLAA